MLLPASVAVVASLAACSTTNLWPFGDESLEHSTAPANAMEYQCAEGKKFYVRNIEKGNAIWLILSDREVALQKSAGDAGEKYSNGISTLTINNGEARLEESPTNIYADCKVPEKKKG
jgi:membrane-bound inhibitor of C-type lysozyme